jgi:hypothetical protein
LAASARDRYFYSLFDTECLSRRDRSDPLVFSLFAFFAALGWVLETFISKEDLLADSPGKVLIAVDAKDALIFYFGRI